MIYEERKNIFCLWNVLSMKCPNTQESKSKFSEETQRSSVATLQNLICLKIEAIFITFDAKYTKYKSYYLGLMVNREIYF